jgi:hypothetical protein
MTETTVAHSNEYVVAAVDVATEDSRLEMLDAWHDLGPCVGSASLVSRAAGVAWRSARDAGRSLA